MAGFFVQLVESVFALPGRFLPVATSDPISALLLVVGGFLTVVASGVFGYLAMGGVLAALAPDTGGRVVHRP